jgi:hypothetical protein
MIVCFRLGFFNKEQVDEFFENKGIIRRKGENIRDAYKFIL